MTRLGHFRFIALLYRETYSLTCSIDVPQRSLQLNSITRNGIKEL